VILHEADYGRRLELTRKGESRHSFGPRLSEAQLPELGRGTL
jgi:hypothetical protein